MTVRRSAVAIATLGVALGAVLGTSGSAFAATERPKPPPTQHEAPAPDRHVAPAPERHEAPVSGRQQAPAVDDATCTVAVAPPPSVDASEQPRPGTLAPPPLPVPAQPVGGPRMSECGNVLPPGAPPPPSVQDSVSWILADLDTGAVLAARSPHARERPASLLKILTSLVIMKRLDMDTVVAGTEADADAPGSRVGVGPGGQYTVRQLFTGLILNSGNDAANALARQLGGVPDTLHYMSETAASLGALDTRPASPSGLDAPGMSTSAYDLALFYRQAIQQPLFAQISKTRLYDWPGRGDLPGFKISNDNHMLTEYPGTFGGKTGFTDDARHTRITAAQKHGRRLVLVQMRGEQHPVPMDTQAARLLDYGFALPADSPPVGQLVDPGGAVRSPAADDSSEAADARLVAGTESTAHAGENMRASIGVIGGGALLGALLSVLVARRRPSGGGRHSTNVPRDQLPDD